MCFEKNPFYIFLNLRLDIFIQHVMQSNRVCIFVTDCPHDYQLFPRKPFLSESQILVKELIFYQ